ncbi:MAG TPA: hypothetical protein VJL28_07505 [Gemmatimonadaceae bacterium]|nr:hypothetical protein [Gemmatimonadaceae bacterium]
MPELKHHAKCAWRTALVAVLLAMAAPLDAQASRPDTSPNPRGVVPENRAMYDLMREMLVAADPKPAYRRFNEEMSCASDWYGMERTRRLVADAENAALKTDADREAYRRMAAKLHGQFFDLPDCTRKKPPASAAPRKPSYSRQRDWIPSPDRSASVSRMETRT